MAKNKIKRIKLYTHTDMDGYSCAVILKLYLESQYQIDVEYLDYTDLDCPKLTFKKDIELYDHIFVTDLNFKSLDMVERLFGIEIGNKYQDTENIKIHYINRNLKEIKNQTNFLLSLGIKKIVVKVSSTALALVLVLLRYECV